MRKIACLMALIFLTMGVFGYTQARIINYQGKVSDSAGQAVNQNGVAVKVEFYDAEVGGSPLGGFSETHTVNIENGLFTLEVGSKTTDGIPSSVFSAGTDVYLSLTINYQEQTPRPKIVSVPYSISSAGSKIDCADFPGTVDAGTYCIDKDISSNKTWYAYAAHSECISRGMRLCSWEEYAIACVKWQAGQLALVNVLRWGEQTQLHTSDRGGSNNRSWGQENDLPPTCYDDTGAIHKSQELGFAGWYHRCCISK